MFDVFFEEYKGKINEQKAFTQSDKRLRMLNSLLNKSDLNTFFGIDWLLECCTEKKKEIKVIELGKVLSSVLAVVALCFTLFSKKLEEHETAYAVSIVVSIGLFIAFGVFSLLKNVLEISLNRNVKIYKQLYRDLGYLKTQLRND